MDEGMRVVIAIGSGASDNSRDKSKTEKVGKKYGPPQAEDDDSDRAEVTLLTA